MNDVKLDLSPSSTALPYKVVYKVVLCTVLVLVLVHYTSRGT